MNASGAAIGTSGTPPSGPARAKAVFTAALPLILILGFAAIDLPLCPTRFFFGVPCPGCGLTRATLAMMTLDLHGVWHFHPLAPILAPVVGWALFRPILEELGLVQKGRVFFRAPMAVWWSLLVALLALYVLRLGGLLGGLPDPVDPAHGAIGTVLSWIAPYTR